MRALFNNLAFLHDDEAVEVGDRGQAVGDGDDGFAFHQIKKGVLDELFGLAVQRAGGFIEYQDGCVFQDGPRDGDTLTLSAGKLYAAFTDQRVIAIGQVGDKFMGVGFFCGLKDFFIAGA